MTSIYSKGLTDRRTKTGSRWAPSHQRGLTQQFAPANQVSDGDVEVGVPAAPVGDLGERMSDEDFLQRESEHRHTAIGLGLPTLGPGTLCSAAFDCKIRPLNPKSALAQLLTWQMSLGAF